MARPKKIFTISEALKFVEDKFLRVTRMPELIGYRSTDITKSYKSVISICNSLSIVFLQYDLFKEAFLMLQKAVAVDTELNKFGNNEERLWQGRIVTYNSLALLFYKLGKHKESLKLLLQAENFLINLTEARISPHIDIEISVNMLTFITLWKVKKYPEAQLYLERSAKLINQILSNRRNSNISKLSSKNLYGIIVMGLAGIKAINQQDVKSSVKLCKEAAGQLDGKNVLSRPLLLDFIKFLSSHKQLDLVLPPISNVEFHPGKFRIFESEESFDSLTSLSSLKLKNAGDWLVNEKYEKVLFITTFVPLISPLAPWIDTAELEIAASRKQGSVSEGYDNVKKKECKKVRTVLRNGGRTESTPRPRVRVDQGFERVRKFSQDPSDRSFTSTGYGRHFMFELSLGSSGNKTLPLELVPIEPANNAVLPKLHKTVINFRNFR